MYLGLVFLYFIGKPFYRLAEFHQRNKWLFGILGIVFYYIGMLISAIIMGAFYIIMFSENDYDGNSFYIQLISVPIGLLTCWGFYKYIKNKWENNTEYSDTESDILDENIFD